MLTDNGLIEFSGRDFRFGIFSQGLKAVDGFFLVVENIENRQELGDKHQFVNPLGQTQDL